MLTLDDNFSNHLNGQLKHIKPQKVVPMSLESGVIDFQNVFMWVLYAIARPC